jgi:hypothetical protein
MLMLLDRTITYKVDKTNANAIKKKIMGTN